jgi:hypothetical protein
MPAKKVRQRHGPAAEKREQPLEQEQTQQNLRRRTIEVECGPILAEDPEPWRPSVERLKQRFRVSSAGDLHPGLSFADKGRSWPSTGWGVVTPDVLEKLQRAREFLIAAGFLVDADPLNDLGDGKSWTLICELTDNTPKVSDLSDLVDQTLRSAGLPVATKPFWDKGKLLVDVWDAVRATAPQEEITNSNVANTTRIEPTEHIRQSVRVGSVTMEDAGHKRAADIVRAQQEIEEIRPLMDCDDDYDRLRTKHPDFMIFKICDRHPDLKQLLLGIKGHHQRRALRFAKEVAAANNHIKLNTIEKAWDKYNPNKKTRTAHPTPDHPEANRKTPSNPPKR